MSARKDLSTALRGSLSQTTHPVKDEAPTNATVIPTGKAYVHVQRAGATASPATAGWAHALVVLVLVGAELYSTAEDALDVLLPPVVDALEALGYPVVSIDRDVFEETFHGYRIVTTVTTPTI